MIAYSFLDFFSTPSSQILYEGEKTTLVCHVEGNAFWQLDGTIYSELNAAYFHCYILRVGGLHHLTFSSAMLNSTRH